MRAHLLAGGVVAAALIPTFALAQQSCEQRRSSQAAGTLAGAGVGALLGGAVAGHDNRAAGAVVGGLGGAVIGNQLSKPGANCARAYGYYDDSGAWHASGVGKEYASGYYDREGAWVDGAPNGHYDRDGRWVQTNSDAAAAGYYDQRGRWVPASANGYYATDGRWVAGAASGYYDRSGRWVAGPATGRYDANGRWLAGQPSRTTEVQPGYYDQGKWRPGPVSGYYDTNGRWIRAEPGVTSSRTTTAPSDISGRLIWLDQRIRYGLDDGSLTQNEGKRALRALNSIARDERSMRTSSGYLRPGDQVTIQARLDTLTNDVRDMRRGPVRQY